MGRILYLRGLANNRWNDFDRFRHHRQQLVLPVRESTLLLLWQSPVLALMLTWGQASVLLAGLLRRNI